MPLRKGSSKEVVLYNVSELIRTGRSIKQAVAIALKEAVKTKKRREQGDQVPKSLSFINKIKEIRVANNDLWMRILEIALEANPSKTKLVIKQIRRNDIAIYENMRRLTDD
jgi:hypothetical protein